MSDYDNKYWPSIRSNLSKVPLSHGVWRVDVSMGDSIWNLAPDDHGSKMVPQRPESPPFRVKLQPIEVFLPDSELSRPSVDLSCGRCSTVLGTYAEQIRHAAEFNSDTHWEIDQQIPSRKDVQVSVDFWDSHYHPCERDGCSKSFTSYHALVLHYQTEYQDRKPFQCSKCNKLFSFETYLRTHEKLYHSSNWPCKKSDCNKKFDTRRQAHIHFAKEHRSGKFECPTCGV